MSKLQDREIAGLVQRALDSKGVLHLADRVDVRVEDSIVQLLGIVCSAGERRIAEETARAVPGVADVINRLTVVIDGKRSDRELQAAVEQALARYPALVRDVGCHVEDGVARLVGHIRRPSQETLAIRVAGSVHGVEDVVSDLTISERVPVVDRPLLDDVTLAGRVADALAAAGVMIQEGGAKVSGGVATLTGKVGSLAERDRAGQAVAEVDGLLAVKNRLTLQKSLLSADADEVLAARVIEALRRDGRVSTSAVRVDAVEDLVLLSGVVNSAEDQEAAEEVARQVPGVHHVVNDVGLSGWR